MGIPGLTTLIKKHYPSRTWRSVTPRGKLVLDGKNIGEIVIDKKWIHGGQYGEPRDHFIRFFSRLRDSGIDPIVIFDGVDYNQEKCVTKLHRKKEKVKKIFDAILEDRITDSVVPIFTDIVFCETLKELGVEFIFADGDADRDTARIANHYNCPVVACDSDYFIFNLKAGYIPLDCLYWDQQPVKAKLYERDRFAYKFYFNHDRDLIYLIPAIMGNDFMKQMKPRSLRGAIADASQEAKKSGTEIKQDEKLDTLYYISTFDTVKDFMTHLYKVCQGSEIRSIKENYKKAKELYDIGEISMTDLRESKNLKTANGTLLPRFIRQEYRKGCFATSVMAVLVLNDSTIPVMIDNPHDYTATRIGKHIRKCIYMILSPYLSRPVVTEITFTHKEDPYPHEERVSWTDVSHLNLPCIDDMQYLSKNKRIELLCRVMETPLKVQETFIESESKWKLVAVSLHYWSQHAHPDIHLIEALVLCFICCSFDETVCPSSDLPDYKRNEMWLEALHIFAQWKCTYYDEFRLNNVLLNPLPFMSPALLFNGKLVMHYACTREFNEDKRRILESSSAKTIFDKLVSVCTCT